MIYEHVCGCGCVSILHGWGGSIQITISGKSFDNSAWKICTLGDLFNAMLCYNMYGIEQIGLRAFISSLKHWKIILGRLHVLW